MRSTFFFFFFFFFFFLIGCLHAINATNKICAFGYMPRAAFVIQNIENGVI